MFLCKKHIKFYIQGKSILKVLSKCRPKSSSLINFVSPTPFHEEMQMLLTDIEGLWIYLYNWVMISGDLGVFQSISCPFCVLQGKYHLTPKLSK